MSVHSHKIKQTKFVGFDCRIKIKKQPTFAWGSLDSQEEWYTDRS